MTNFPFRPDWDIGKIYTLVVAYTRCCIEANWWCKRRCWDYDLYWVDGRYEIGFDIWIGPLELHILWFKPSIFTDYSPGKWLSFYSIGK